LYAQLICVHCVKRAKCKIEIIPHVEYLATWYHKLRHSVLSLVAEQYKWVRGPVAPMTFDVDDFIHSKDEEFFGRFIFLK
jgi:hypothetical protein